MGKFKVEWSALALWGVVLLSAISCLILKQEDLAQLLFAAAIGQMMPTPAKLKTKPAAGAQ